MHVEGKRRNKFMTEYMLQYSKPQTAVTENNQSENISGKINRRKLYKVPKPLDLSGIRSEKDEHLPRKKTVTEYQQ